MAEPSSPGLPVLPAAALPGAAPLALPVPGAERSGAASRGLAPPGKVPAAAPRPGTQWELEQGPPRVPLPGGQVALAGTGEQERGRLRSAASSAAPMG